MLLELTRHGAYIGGSLLQGDSVFEAGEAEEPVTSAARTLIVLGCPELGRLGGSEVEIAGKDSDDRVGIAVKGDAFSKHIGASAIAILPRCISEQDRAGRGGPVFSVGKISPENRSDAERSEESAAHLHGRNGLSSGWRAEQIAKLVVGIERRENLVLLFPIKKVIIGDVAAGKYRGGFGDIDQTLSRLCSVGKFNQRVPYRFVGHFKGPKGSAMLGAAKGSGLNLFDPQHKADKQHDYWFYRDRTADCIVFSAVVKPPAAAGGARSTLGQGG